MADASVDESTRTVDMTDRSEAAKVDADMTQVAANAEAKEKKNKPKKEPKEPKQKQPQQAKKKTDDTALIGITKTKEEDLADWYQQVLIKGDFLEYSDIPGCYIYNVCRMLYAWVVRRC